MRHFLLLIGTCLFAQFALGAVQTKVIEYKDGDTVLEGFLAWDDAVASEAKPAPGVLVIPEWWGNNDYSRGRAKQLAELGYVAFAIDMYGKGKTTTDPKQAGQWSGEIMKDEKARRARSTAGLKILQDQKSVDTARIGVIGYCMGGTLAVDLARTGANLQAVVAFHASTFTASKPEENKQIKGTVLICHGAEDGFVPAGEVDKFQAQMKEAGVDFVLVSFSGAVHSFTNSGVDKMGVPGAKYNASAAKRSWVMMKEIFREKLGEEKSKS
ncbi:MAG: dienelactone hydrolase family protein [Phycisphaerales bacterium]